MSELKTLLAEQAANISMMSSARSNFKKASQTRHTVNNITSRLNTINDLFSQFRQTHTNIFKQCVDDKKDPEHSYFANDHYGAQEELYYEFVESLQNILDKLSPVAQNKNLPPGSADTSLSSMQKDTSHKIKLPLFTLTKFNGQYDSWRSFKDLFTSMVHNNHTVANVQKLQYLIGNLEGEAYSLLKHFQITDGNYALAWQLLNERYENKRLLLNTQFKRLVTDPKINDTADGIRHLLDSTNDMLASIKNLQIDITSWDPFIAYMIIEKLPAESRALWEQGLKPNEIPTYKVLEEFLQARFRTLEVLSKNTVRNVGRREAKSFYVANAAENTQYSCSICKNGNHPVRQCPTLLQASVNSRINMVQDRKLCKNCFAYSHNTAKCGSKKLCSKCNKRHNLLLHIDGFGNRNSQLSQISSNEEPHHTTQVNQPSTSTAIPSESTHQISTNHHLSSTILEKQQILLATALVTVTSPKGVTHTLRALLDQGSQATFITEAAVQLMGLQKSATSILVTGLGKAKTPTPSSTVTCNLGSPHTPNFNINIQALVMKCLTKVMPSHRLILRSEFIGGLTLADPNFGKPGKIDLMLGADVYSQILLHGIRKEDNDCLLAQNTVFGWILSGQVNFNANNPRIACHHLSIDHDIDRSLKKFWELEELSAERCLTKEELECETHYQETQQRDKQGKYVVRLPFKAIQNGTPELGRSRQIAISRLLQVERRLKNEPILQQQYTECMSEYISLNHMVEVAANEHEHAVTHSDGRVTFTCCYLPHHSVVKETSSTTKLRVVFDASCKTENGKSLNDCVMTGPTIQPTLTSLLLRWRMYPVVIKADIAKMFRQVEVAEPDVEYQRIVWRLNSTQPIKDYRLSTVTFGMACAPYLAVRTLMQIATDIQAEYPVAAHAIRNCFYVDDFMTGADNIKDALLLQTQIIQVLKAAKFELRKWSSNKNQLIESVLPADREFESFLNINLDNMVKTLGIDWQPTTDEFRIKVQQSSSELVYTKRTLLAEAARLFDPLGWVAPSVIIAKIIFQKLWLLGLSWDDPLPVAVNDEWKEFRKNLSRLENIKIPRWVSTYTTTTDVQLHGFCDASERAYAAVLYLRVADQNNYVRVHLITAKTKVAPIKQVSLPRLELCGAVLLANLIETVQKDLHPKSIHAWTDSTIVLSWLRQHPNKWKTFVANRVSEIHTLVKQNIWNHVVSRDNPADCASRGVNPSELEAHPLWWYGPDWLKQPVREWPKNKINDYQTEVELKHVSTHMVSVHDFYDELLSRFSSITRLIRVTSYCLRIVKRRSPNAVKTTWLTPDELQAAQLIWIKHSQSTAFAEELSNLKAHGEVNKKSQLRVLHPFIDSFGIIRVGGRLDKAKHIYYNEKHPAILPKRGKLTELIINRAHLETLHGGTQIVLSQLRKQYWLIDGRNCIRHLIHKCVICYRLKAVGQQQLMGDLPDYRLEVCRPFTNTGVDYAGPIELLISKGRGRRQMSKAYISLFVCLSTKAIHLELVSDMTTNAFMAAFTRFVSRRGKPSIMYSDNGTTFKGATNQQHIELQQLHQQLSPEIAELLANDSIDWKFIPPASPHFGGLWEAGVKSTKFHLKRILGNTSCTFEEMTTALAAIEGCLNSRPICPLTNDANDLSVLTPGHFLTGDSIISPSRPQLMDLNVNRLDRWQMVQRLSEHFWKRWSHEYTARLQQRPKWTSTQPNLETDNMVIIRDERLPPSRWRLGRVIETHPGKDGIVRVATVKTATGIGKSPVTKLCLLPIVKAQTDHDNTNSNTTLH